MTHDPAVDIGFSPSPVVEGATVNFSDQSTFQGAQQEAWHFSDGTPTVFGANPSHVFEDNGTYPVQLTVTDVNGVAHTGTVDVAVQNVAPTVTINSVASIVDPVAGGLVDQLHVSLDDPGRFDRFLLHAKITSTRTGFPNLSELLTPSGDTVLTMPIDTPTAKLASGYWPVTVTVTDKDGAVAKESVLLFVSAPTPHVATPVFHAASRVVAKVAAVTPAAIVPPPAVTSFTAFVVDRIDPVTGDAVTLRNVSQVSGVPIAAAITTGDGRPDFSLAAARFDVGDVSRRGHLHARDAYRRGDGDHRPLGQWCEHRTEPCVHGRHRGGGGRSPRSCGPRSLARVEAPSPAER